uniref:Reelin n=1 Tax=Catagonus wagneri TaxID=51154 RepID=A0A8C3X6X5_9CETA
MGRSCWAPRTFLLALLLGATLRAHAAVGYYPRFSPFFFLCTHHGELEGDGEQGEVLISLHIAGHPTYYVPGQEYHVTISTSTFFDGLLVTGLYTSTSVQASQSIGGSNAFGFGIMSDHQFGNQFMCSVVASHVSHLPTTNLSFVWIAPPAGTGCVNFMATATHRGQIIFKDALAQQLCEQGAPTEATVHPHLAEIHSDSVILRDDFDSYHQQELNPNIWVECNNCETGEQCGAIMHGNAVTFCEPYGPRELVTTSLNTTTASVLQFSIGSGSCRFSYSDPCIIVSYAKNNTADWIQLEKIRAPSNVSTIIHILYLPEDAKGENVQFQWKQENLHVGEVYEACWALDNILVINSAHRQVILEDNLDPVDTGNWLFFPGATVKHSCQSDGNSIYFHGNEGSEFNFATTRDVDLSTEDIQEQWSEEFESQPTGWDILGAVIGTECGTIESGLSMVFLKDGERKICTPYMDVTGYGNLRFYFVMGGICDPGDSHENDIILYAKIEGRKEHIALDTLSYSSYKVPSLVSVVINPELQTPATKFCLRQKNHQGHNRNVWAIDFFHVLPVLPSTMSHMIQFSINLGCGTQQPGNSVSLEFSTNHGRSWSLLHTECLPEICAGPHLPHSTIYSSENYSGWNRITIPLPNAALTRDTRIRWRQTGPILGNMWAIDNVYIGPSCLKFCSGRGQCTRHGCKCDPGFSGPACEMASQTFPMFISESFGSSRLSSYHNFYSIRGAEVSFGCGVLASGKALVFNKDGRRQLITSFLDSSQSRFLQFTLRLGSKSVLSTCRAPDQPGEGVLLHYSYDNGITWKLLEHYSYLNYHEPRIISVELPDDARQFGIQFRWWQPYHSSQGEDVWAIDEIIMTSVLFNSISLDFTNLVEVTQSLGFYLGNVQPYCGHDWTLCFTGDSKLASSMRYVETQSMQIGASYMIQFSLVMGCGQKYTPHMDNQVKLEYSTNHGLTWHLVQEECLPSMPSCQEFTSASIYHASEFTQWRRVIVLLPQKTWSSATRFRWSQSYYTAEDEWALDSIYIGQQCPNMCRGHGSCDRGVCRCDRGFQGTECHPEAALPSTIMSDFENPNTWESDWQEVIGGEIVKPEEGCGVISSGSSLYFSKAGKRQLVSWDLDTSWVDFVQFYIQIGGESTACNKPDSREEGVLLQYSNNGGIQWHLLAEMYFSDFSKPRFVYLELPAAAKTPCTRFRWWQPVFSGEDYDQWAVDDIIILSEKQKQIIPVVNPTLPQNFYEKPAFDYPMNQMSVWLMLANEGMAKNETFCSATPSAMVFGKSDGDRFAVTRDLTLKPGYVLQFKLNIGCANQFSSAAPVLLQYSHDAGMSWFLVKEGCYPASAGKGCEGNSRELSEPTVYHMGDFEEWTRITIVIPRPLASSKTRFRWIQESSSQKNVPPFGLDGVYISEPCPSYCSGHGDCVSGVCFCDLGYTAAQGTCVSVVPNHSEMFDRFEGKLSPLWYKITGGQVGTGCGTLNDGKSLYFSGPGKREVRTVPLDTRNIRLVQFYVQIGSKTSGITCIKPRARNEGKLLCLHRSYAFIKIFILLCNEPSQTTFIHLISGKHSAQWALDDVLIGMNDSSQTGFQDKFDGSLDLQANWFRIQGGQVDIDCLSMDTALTFTENIGKPRYAETWDFHVSASTFLQFEMSMGCSKPFSDSHGVQLQYSLNNGRDWHLVTEECVPPTIGCLHYTESSVYTSERFQNWKRITVYLPFSTISPRTRFRWIQANYTVGADAWAIDNVVLASGCPWMCSGRGICDAGRCVCDRGFGGAYCVPVIPLPSILKDDFNGNLHPDLWPEVYGAERGNLNSETIKSGTSLIFKGEGLRMLISRDLDCTNTMYVQFSLRFIAKGTPERSHSILLQFSISGGITWHLMDEFYFPQTTNILFINVPLPNTAQTNATRFRLWQPYNNGKKEEIWIVDDFIIDGNNLNNPVMLLDTFDFGPREDNWFFYPGGNIGLYCPYSSKGAPEEDSAMVFVSNEVGEHSITTRDLDVNENTVIQFEINVGCSTDSASADPVRLEFSRDFGATWHLLLPLCYHSSSHVSSLCSTEHHPSSTYYAGTTQGWRREVVHFGKLHLCGLSFFNWYSNLSPSESVPFSYKIILDSACTPSTLVSPYIVFPPKIQGSLFPRGDWFRNSFSFCFSLFLQGPEISLAQIHSQGIYSTVWLGLVHQSLTKNSTIMNAFSEHRRACVCVCVTLLHAAVQTWQNTSFTIILFLQRSQATRFRWHQPAPFDKQQTWAIDNVYIGDGCIDMCSGHGRCIQGNCVCDEQWGGLYCDEPETSLPTQLKDNFNRAPSNQNWLTVNGGKLSTVCGAVASGMALHFSGGCSRLLVTVDLNLTNAEFIQFYFMYGCLITPNNRNQGVLLEYSVNGGITWNLLMEIFYDQYSKPGFVNILLPPDAKEMATRFRWWQPRHDGLDQNDWAIDNVLISGSADQRTVMLDTFSSAPLPQHERSPADAGPVGRIAFDMFMEDKTTVNEHWLFHDDCTVERFCDSPDGVMICGSEDGREVYAVTHDLTPTEGWIMQFKISVGCKVSEKVAQNQIHVQYSTDFGVSWNYLVPQCLPADPKCSGSVSQPSVFFPTKGWKRITYPLPESLVGNPVRFRFYQKHSDMQWAIDNFYLGPECLDNCRGHGDCLKEQCICDPGYSGPNCYLTHTLKTFLKERFDSEEIKPDLWMSLEGGSTCTECGVLAEDTALYFGGSTVRQAITQDLDLRGAKFLQYWGRIGSENNMTSCHRPICRKEGVLLDYSTDGGITWTLLHEMDYQKYISVRHDYILLPEDALTNTTRLRWWQPFVISNGLVVSGVERAQWALDNILIGGAEINPSQLVDTFDDEGTSHEENWSFYPNAVRTAGFCGNPSFHLYWPNKKKDKTHNVLSSRELIIQPGYMMQFKIVVGCEATSCGDLHSVMLEYTKDARSDSWQLVQTQCLPSSSNSIGCSPFQFHEATIYNAVNSSSWKRVTIQLPDHVSSSATQFRWIQKGEETEKQSWAIDHVYIGEACPKLCSGHGYCTTGAVCICDESFQGDDCSVFSHDLPSYIKDNFESSRVTEANWETIQGGVIGSGCGQLAPYAHGDSLYFNGCQIRQAATKPLDLTRASKIMFVLQIGSAAQTDSCNSDLSGPHAVDKAVLLQYSVNNGITWHVIAQHQPKDFTQAQRVSYNVPLEARMKGVLLRWWQPRHNGTGHDQWALDHVEVVLTRKQNYMMNFSRQHGLRHFYNRRRRSLRRYA